ncbi:methyltransferase type 11 [Rhizobium favelukesii]|uniref:Methyltransferase type 11 n=1 Tax=Rhizobium favelukesii TaxID=348824 RepID=W6RW75_9HYPH|nr:methyltransferase type 11 [Rhizobium favelukesii]
MRGLYRVLVGQASQLSRSLHGLDGAHWESIQAVLPDLHGTRIVDLGCGSGWFARCAARQGAKSVFGFDISERMIDRARRHTVNHSVSDEIANLERPQLLPASFDLGYSSLAFHDIEDFTRLSATIHRARVPGADVVFFDRASDLYGAGQSRLGGGWRRAPDLAA